MSAHLYELGGTQVIFLQVFNLLYDYNSILTLLANYAFSTNSYSTSKSYI